VTVRSGLRRGEPREQVGAQARQALGQDLGEEQRARAPWYRTKQAPSLADMLAALRLER
jgi:hypothetical protein